MLSSECKYSRATPAHLRLANPGGADDLGELPHGDTSAQRLIQPAERGGQPPAAAQPHTLLQKRERLRKSARTSIDCSETPNPEQAREAGKKRQGYRLAGRAGDLADVGHGGAGDGDAGVEEAHELHLRQRQHVLEDGYSGLARGGGRFHCDRRRKGGFGVEVEGVADLGRGEAARGEEVGEVGRQLHLRDQLVRHRRGNVGARRLGDDGKRERGWGFGRKFDSKLVLRKLTQYKRNRRFQYH